MPVPAHGQMAVRLSDSGSRGRSPIEWECKDWKAWHDLMPGHPPTLHVSGKCAFPYPGYEARLVDHEPQGSNRRDLLLDLGVIEPTDPNPEVVTTVEVHYEKETDAEYDTVSIIGQALGIQVEDVS
jgi:hypothetical protein